MQNTLIFSSFFFYIDNKMRDLQGFGGCRWSLELQRKHASVESQIVQLQSFTKDSEEEGSFGQGVGGNLSLPCC